MSHIFISYSRKDLDFAQKIVTALAENELDTWIDWKSIPKGEDWEQEIYRGIEAADAFLFLISPDSVTSEMCNKEIAHAVRNGKRILPIVIRDTNVNNFLDETSKKEISKRNWIFCRYEKESNNDIIELDDFDNAIKETHKTIHADYEWLKFHTKLQLRALEWERNGHEDSFLLHDKELNATENIFITNLNKEPFPTELQQQYLAKSRVSQNLKIREAEKTRARLRRLAVILSGIAVCAVIATSFAIWFGSQVGSAQIGEQQAQATATVALGREEIQTNIALSRRLATEAQLVYGQQTNGPLIAALLAIESEIRNPNAEADQILRNSLNLLLLPFDNISVPESELITSIAISPDGRLIAAGDFNHTARIWNADTGEEIALLPHDDRVYDVQFSADGQKLFTASGDGNITAWEIASNAVMIQINHEPGFTVFALSADGSRLVTGGVDGTVQVWNVDTFSRLSTFMNNAEVLAVGISPDGNFIASASEDNVAMVWDSRDGKEIIHNMLEGLPSRSISFRPDGKQVLFGGYYGPQVEVWNVKTGSSDFRLDSEGVGLFSPNGEMIAISYRSGDIEIRNSQTGDLITTMTHHFAVQDMVFSPDSRYLVSSSDDGSTRLWDVISGREVGRMLQASQVFTNIISPNGKLIASAGVDKAIHFWSYPSFHRSLLQSTDKTRVNAKIDPSGTWIASWDQGGTSLQMIEISKGTKAILTDSGSPILGIDFSLDSRLIAVSRQDGTVCIWEVLTNQQTMCFAPNQPTTNVRFSQDARWIASVDNKNVQVWDTGTGHQVTQLTSNYLISVFAFSPDGNRLAIGAGGDYRIELWDVVAGLKTTEFQHDPSVNITDLAFSSDGRWLISSGIDGTARVWNLETMHEQSRQIYDPNLYLNRYEVLTTKISPDQKRLVSVNTITHMTASGDPTTIQESEIRVWELFSGEIISRMVHPAWVKDIGWSPDGKYVFSIGMDGFVRIWDVTTGSEIARITHDSEVIQLGFTSDGTQIVSISADGVYGHSYWKPDDMVAQTCLHLTRNLSSSEWQQYFAGIEYHATCPNLPVPEEPK